MHLQNVFEARRSIRKYAPEAEHALTPEIARSLVEAALLAPSWKNCEATRYYFLLDTKEKEAFRTACLPNSNAAKSANASALAILTFVQNQAGFHLREPDGPANELGNTWGAYDTGIATAYLLLKARELGFDSLVIGIRDEAAIRKQLAIPENETILSVLALGVAAPDVPPGRPPRKAVTDVMRISGMRS